MSDAGARTLGAVTVLIGAAMATRPGTVGSWAAGPGDPPPPAVVRVLGVREVLQGAAVAGRPGRSVIGTGILVDVTHAATMVAAALLLPRYRRSATVSGALAGLSAVAGLLVLPRRRR